MDDDFKSVLVGMMLASILWVAFFVVMIEPTTDRGYRQAYSDMHEGTIEAKVQKQHPDLWIKYNVTNKEKR